MKINSKTILPFRYPGGKYYAIKKILPIIQHIEFDEYREPFFGGGAIFWGKEKSKYNWINDKYYELILTLKYMQNPETREILSNMFNEEEATKEKYEEVKKLIPTNELETVYKFYYLNRTSYSGKMKSPSWGYRPKRSLPPYRWKERIIPCGEKLENVKITSLDFEEVISAPSLGKKTMIFADPPYYEANQQSHYVHYFSNNDHLRLAELLRNTNHYFVLTYDDCEDIRNLYFWANIQSLDFHYRLDNSNNNERTRKRGKEILITNFEYK
ncbi:DNA adenine methylase [Staphylococcus hominis]|uniref:DNA adenine methylase n=1 Tax=Staphylococcus hominis TaxID=1290 RepID=UPI0022E82E03|nr:DNA adenine methylase [Staphylococcus hominis]